jgi:hypothetical protein
MYACSTLYAAEALATSKLRMYAALATSKLRMYASSARLMRQRRLGAV